MMESTPEGLCARTKHEILRDRHTKPAVLPVNIGEIPTVLRELDRWVLWRLLWNGSEWTKVPFTASGPPASTVDAVSWSTFETVLSAYQQGGFDGIGIVLGDGLAGVDLDECRDRTTGAIEPWARPIIEKIASYWEISPTGTGVKIFAWGDLPPGGRRHGKIELYDRGRFFTVTGARGNIATVENRAGALAELHAETFIEKKNTSNGAVTPVQVSVLDDAQVLALARSASNGTKFTKLFTGDTSVYDGDDSRADLALISVLAFYTRDPDQLDRLFRRSGLYRGKWEREDYRVRTIATALATVSESYKAARKKGRSTAVQNGATGNDLSAHNALIAQGHPDQDAEDELERTATREWPEEIKRQAFHGLAGEFVKAVAPHSEADPAALLVQFLVVIGNVVGRNPHYFVEADRHHAAEFVGVVGDTSRARKGTGLGRVLHAVELALAESYGGHQLSGLTSGEGLIWAIRDRIETRQPIKEKGRVVDYEFVETDPGVADKRLLVVETELASTLRAFQRDGNRLSPILRDAWDGRDLRNPVKGAPAKATAPHISIIGHITAEELTRDLDRTEIANGFLNRFLLVCARRSKLLPFGGNLDGEALRPIAERIAGVVAWANAHERRIQFSPPAASAWENVYPALTEATPGLLGAVIARAEAHVVRLALIYAILDCSDAIEIEHLKAAIAVWTYCEQSARFLFGDALGDPVADAILDALREAAGGLTLSEIGELFGRHQKSSRIRAALATLSRLNLARCQAEPTGGRTAERWLAVRTGDRAESAKSGESSR